MSQATLSETDIVVSAAVKPEQMTVLIFAAEPPASVLALALQRDLNARVQVVSDQRQYQDLLQRTQFTLVVLEESLARVDRDLYRLAGDALVMEANFGITTADRLLSRIGPALRRRDQDTAQAQAAAARRLHSELNGVLTGLLMEAQLALRQASPGMAPALGRIVDLAEILCERLQDAPDSSVANASTPNLHHR